ncbi:T9SS type A sorting domain-containing protein [Chryseobacterium sp. YR221]|uniref:T9SS type A sorting domain-containing protein n=1 Tax=Chryseobacterium sp. YR221 TaxID=1500293 RepID=UPI0009D8A451|nr:T9SS type A sorting domain-containing protein [Chryseobacterium sp. YR221]SMC32170.1 Por secretion system C-terminal sorting domain-containing protein [Chryseobacterium sp. YR221]
MSLFFGNYNVFHDSVSNTNKIIIETWDNNNNQIYDVYGLPTSVLSSKEIQNVTKLSAFPIPTSKILHISNPENGSNTVEIYDMTGSRMLTKNFGSSDTTISVDVENLPKGIYFYKIGALSSKFIKN